MWGVEPNVDAVREAAAAGYEQVATGPFPEACEQLGRNQFDVIFFNDVLEHLADPEAALRATHDYLAAGGTIIASIPNVRHFSVVWPLIRRGEWRYEDSGIMDRTHLRFFTSKSMREMFRDAGWDVFRVSGINRARWPLGGADSRKLDLLSRLTRGRSDHFFFTQYAVEAKWP
jgi:2-polyprenyl-3-methyl-5-hydroxy-6-metoxy-1,4-benzoquinol methylase